MQLKMMLLQVPEIPCFTNLATKATLNAKINALKNKILKNTNLAATIALTAVENKIPNGSNLVKKVNYNTKISEIENKIITDHDHDKYITIQEFNTLTSENFAARLKQAELATKIEIVDLVKKTDFDDKLKNINTKIASNKTKHVLVENEF